VRSDLGCFADSEVAGAAMVAAMMLVGGGVMQET
jgi:hypothetical protein